MITWKQPTVPRHVCQMLVVDKHSLMMLIHRSENNISARNVWSMPSGTQELGETTFDCISRELMEELTLMPIQVQLLDQYENIAGDSENPEQFHWVISLYMVLVKDISKFVNNEPNKHDQILITNYNILEDELFLENFVFHTSLQLTLTRNRFHYHRNLMYFINPFIVDSSNVAKLTITP